MSDKKFLHLRIDESNVDEYIKNRQYEAEAKFGVGFNSSHELYAVLLEEVEEFWDSIKINVPDINKLLDVLAVSRMGTCWIYKKETNNESDVDQYIKDRYTITKTQYNKEFSNSLEFYYLLIQKMDNLWISVKNNTFNAERTADVFAIAKIGMIWICQQKRDQEG